MRRNQTGSMLVEVIIALSVLTVGLLGFFSAFMSNARASNEVIEQDEARVALENLVETLRTSDFDSLYDTYNMMWLEVPNLEWYGGSTAFAYVSFYVDETYIPSVFGPVTDIDGDPSTQSWDCSSSYRVLPTRVLLWYWSPEGQYRLKSLYLMLGKS